MTRSRSDSRLRLALPLVGVLAAMLSTDGETWAQSITTGDLELDLQLVFNGEGLPLSTLAYPTQVVTNGDGSGDIYLSELGVNFGNGGGRIRKLTPSGAFSTYLDVGAAAPDIHPLGSGALGLLGMTFHPDFNEVGSLGYRKFYTYHTETIPTSPVTIDFTVPAGQTAHHHTVVTEWQASATNPSIADPSTKREVLRTEHIDEYHSGGAIDFDSSGNLFITIGTSHAYRPGSQDTNTIEGTLLRIDPIDPSLTPTSPNAASPTGRYRIPSDNPFVSGGGLGEIYAYGLRSPHRGNYDAESGLFFMGDVGQSKYEEVNAIAPGENFGWPYREGTHNGLSTPTPEILATLTPPIAEYGRGDGRSVIGGFVYRGSIPELQGKYIFGEFSFGSGGFDDPPGRIFWTDPFDGEGNLNTIEENTVYEFVFSPETQELFKSDNGLFDTTLYSFGEDDDGEILIVGTAQSSTRTRLYRITDAKFRSPGDFNGDGLVDAADYTIWRDHSNETGIRLQADANNDLTVNAADYAVWQSTYGGLASSPSLAELAVPSPTGATLLACLATCLVGRVRK